MNVSTPFAFIHLHAEHSWTTQMKRTNVDERARERTRVAFRPAAILSDTLGMPVLF